MIFNGSNESIPTLDTTILDTMIIDTTTEDQPIDSTGVVEAEKSVKLSINVFFFFSSRYYYCCVSVLSSGDTSNRRNSSGCWCGYVHQEKERWPGFQARNVSQ